MFTRVKSKVVPEDSLKGKDNLQMRGNKHDGLNLHYVGLIIKIQSSPMILVSFYSKSVGKIDSY